MDAPADAPTASSNPLSVDAVWVAFGKDILKVAASNGSIPLQITELVGIRNTAVDPQRRVLWAFAKTDLEATEGENHRTAGAGGGQEMLHAFDFDGRLLFTVPLAGLAGGDPGEEPGQFALAVNSKDGAVWLGIGMVICQFDSNGDLLKSLALRRNVLALALDEANSLLWIATDNEVSALDLVKSAHFSALDLGKNSKVKDIDVDAGSGEIWVALEKSVRRYHFNGLLQSETAVGNPMLVSSDDAGGAWVATEKELLRIESGKVVLRIEPFRGLTLQGGGAIVALAADPADLSVWVAAQKALRKITPAGNIIHSLEFAGNGAALLVNDSLRDLALFRDRSAPAINITSPVDGAVVETNRPTIDLSYSDDADPSTLAFKVNGSAHAMSCTVNTLTASCTPSKDLPEGDVTMTATIADFSGNVSAPAEVKFKVRLPRFGISSW